MNTITLLLFGVLLGLVIAVFPVLELVRWLSPRLGIRGVRAFLSLLVHDVLPERNSTFQKLERRIAHRIAKESLTLSSGRTFAYALIRVRVSPHDLVVITETIERPLLAEDLAARYTAVAERQRWQLPASGIVSVVIEADPRLGPGVVEVDGVMGIGYGDRPVAPTPDLHRGADEGASVVVPKPDAPGPAISDSPETVADPPSRTVPYSEPLCHATLSAEGRSMTVSSVQGPVRIGRGLDSTLVLTGSGVSQLHATLVHSSDGWTITPEPKAKNGLFIDGDEAWRPQRLSTRARIGLGTHTTVEFVSSCSHRDDAHA